MIKRVVEETPRPICDVIPEVPAWLCDLIARLQAKKPDERFQSAREVADLLAEYESRLQAGAKPNELAPDSSAKPGSSRSGQWKWVVAVVFAVLALSMAELIGLTHLFRRQESNSTKPGDDPMPGLVAEQKREPLPDVQKETDATPKGAAPTTDPDRRAAEFVLSVGGTVRLNDDGREIRVSADLPTGALRLIDARMGYQLLPVSALAIFKGCKHLKYLALTGGVVTDAGLARFKDCTNLTFLNLHDNELVTDTGLAHLKGCTKLVMLDLSNASQVGDIGVAHFKDCKDLRTLALYGTKVGDTGLGALKGCTNMRSIYLGGTAVTAAGLAKLKEWKNLMVLGLDECQQVTDAGLVHLAGLNKLVEVDLCKTQVTDKGVAELAKTLPRCKITWDGGVIEPR